MLKGWGKRWLMVYCPFRALVVPYRMLALFTWFGMIRIWAIASALIHLPRMVLSTKFLCENYGFDELPRTSFISSFHSKIRNISRVISGVANASCSVWCREWTTCSWSTFWDNGSERQVALKFYILENNLLFMFAFIIVVTHDTSFAYYFFRIWVYSEIAFSY